jgi:Family of unknown function (DUF5330)
MLQRDISKGTPEGEAMGMLRTLIIVGAGLALMPSPPPGEGGQEPAQGPGSFAYLAAAAETFADLRSFCQRNPGVCSTAGAFAQTVEGKAKYSAKIIYEWANNSSAPQRPEGLPADIAAADPIQTSAPPAKASKLKQSQNTLTVSDLLPEWKKPKPLPKG